MIDLNLNFCLTQLSHYRWKERFPKMVRIMHGYVLLCTVPFMICSVNLNSFTYTAYSTDYHPDASSFEYLLRGGSEWAPEPGLWALL
jgi:hypothetical protein